VIKYVDAVPGDTARGAGWLIFVRDGALLARTFDTSRLEFTGEPLSLSDKVWTQVFSNIGSRLKKSVLSPTAAIPDRHFRPLGL
jgi:hypothetical protein